MRSHRSSPRPLTAKAAILGNANPTPDHDGFRPKADLAAKRKSVLSRGFELATFSRFYADFLLMNTRPSRADRNNGSAAGTGTGAAPGSMEKNPTELMASRLPGITSKVLASTATFNQISVATIVQFAVKGSLSSSATARLKNAIKPGKPPNSTFGS